MSRPHPCPHHYPKGGNGGGGLAVALVVLVVIAAAARPALQAVGDAARLVLHVAEVGLISLGALAALAGVGWAASRVLARQGRVALETQARPPRISARRTPGVEASRADRTAELELQLAQARAQLVMPQQHLHLHGLAAQIAAIISRQHDPTPPAID